MLLAPSYNFVMINNGKTDETIPDVLTIFFINDGQTNGTTPDNMTINMDWSISMIMVVTSINIV